MTYDYRGKVVLVTGGAGGIARAFLGPVASLGATCAVVDIRTEAAERTAAALPGAGHAGYGCDLTDQAQVEALLTRVGAEHGRIDVLVNNVGMTSADRFDERSVESIRTELEVNLLSPLVLTRLAVPLLRAAPDPRVVTTVSLGGIFPLGETPIYTASKFGLRGAMLAIGLDLRAKGITAGSVLPSATDTRMLRREAVEGGNSLQFQDPPQPPEVVARTMMRMLDRPALERYPRPSEAVLVKTAMLVPNALPRLMRLFRRRGERGMAAYLARLERAGIAHRRDGRWALVDDERALPHP
ncbi:SDR family NAD(P)-dependent oxidoreductase [Cellulomonas sp. ES6]|uniref:SDR family NAD(P)-dependent oxidoreductase n=1 Tax=Cellulomonas sp. ES6 TaxID=3039384 RepID=UPI0024B86905|nr:SDR family NAD(P)-dependent oxidoreductase [Cellulomonas sp. ES6]WHP19027.1 SDR family NAD(P)-dependent oxidoreductase [Cellulomonas sp. ES6]